MSNKLLVCEEELQRVLSSAWEQLEALLSSVSGRVVPPATRAIVLWSLGFAFVADTALGWNPAAGAMEALVPVDVAFSPIVPVLLSATASAVVIGVGFMADLARSSFTGVKGMALFAAALLPLSLVGGITVASLADLLTLVGEDALPISSLVKLLAPAVVAAGAHTTVLVSSANFVESLRQRKQTQIRPHLLKTCTEARAAAREYVSCYLEQEAAIARLATFGNRSMRAVGLDMPPQSATYLRVAEALAGAGDPIQILLDLRRLCHPDARHNPDPLQRATSASTASLTTDDNVINESHRRNGISRAVVVGVIAAMLVFPTIADANRLPSRTGGRGYQTIGGRPPATSRAMPPSRTVNRAPIPRAQESPTPALMAERRKMLPQSRSWLFTADLQRTNALSRSGHRYVANRQLAKAMERDHVLRSRVENRFGADSYERLRRNRNPRGAQWDHNARAMDYLHLMTKADHAKVTRTQGRAGGGYKIYGDKRARRAALRPRPAGRRGARR